MYKKRVGGWTFLIGWVGGSSTSNSHLFFISNQGDNANEKLRLPILDPSKSITGNSCNDTNDDSIMIPYWTTNPIQDQRSEKELAKVKMEQEVIL